MEEWTTTEKNVTQLNILENNRLSKCRLHLVTHAWDHSKIILVWAYSAKGRNRSEISGKRQLCSEIQVLTAVKMSVVVWIMTSCGPARVPLFLRPGLCCRRLRWLAWCMQIASHSSPWFRVIAMLTLGPVKPSTFMEAHEPQHELENFRLNFRLTTYNTRGRHNPEEHKGHRLWSRLRHHSGIRMYKFAKASLSGFVKNRKPTNAFCLLWPLTKTT